MQSTKQHVNKAMQRVPLARRSKRAAFSKIIYGSSLHFIWEVKEMKTSKERQRYCCKVVFAEKIWKNLLLQVQSLFHQFSRKCFVKLSVNIENP